LGLCSLVLYSNKDGYTGPSANPDIYERVGSGILNFLPESVLAKVAPFVTPYTPYGIGACIGIVGCLVGFGYYLHYTRAIEHLDQPGNKLLMHIHHQDVGSGTQTARVQNFNSLVDQYTMHMHHADVCFKVSDGAYNAVYIYLNTPISS
jgi:hypothetical protein